MRSLFRKPSRNLWQSVERMQLRGCVFDELLRELGQRLNGNGLCLLVRSQKLRLGRQEVRNQSYAATWNLESPEPETEPRWHLQHLSCRDRLVVALHVAMQCCRGSHHLCDAGNIYP